MRRIVVFSSLMSSLALSLLALSLLVSTAAVALAQTPAATQAPPTAGQAGEMHHGTHAPLPAGPLKITFGDKSAEWTPATLAPLPHQTLTLYNEHAKANQTFTGVPLIDLLAQLGVPAKPRGKDFKLYIVAEGSDGYQVV
jgi:hypothetical protein